MRPTTHALRIETVRSSRDADRPGPKPGPRCELRETVPPVAARKRHRRPREEDEVGRCREKDEKPDRGERHVEAPVEGHRLADRRDGLEATGHPGDAEERESRRHQRSRPVEEPERERLPGRKRLRGPLLEEVSPWCKPEHDDGRRGQQAEERHEVIPPPAEVDERPSRPAQRIEDRGVGSEVDGDADPLERPRGRGGPGCEHA